MTAADAMLSDFPRIDPRHTIRQAVELLLESDWDSGFVLTAQGEAAGILGRREVLRALSEKTGGFFGWRELSFAFIRGEAFNSEALRQLWRSFWELPVESVMRCDVPEVSEEVSLAVVVHRFAGGEADAVAVVRRGKVIGALRPHAVLACMAAPPTDTGGTRRIPPSRDFIGGPIHD